MTSYLCGKEDGYAYSDELTARPFVVPTFPLKVEMNPLALAEHKRAACRPNVIKIIRIEKGCKREESGKACKKAYQTAFFCFWV